MATIYIIRKIQFYDWQKNAKPVPVSDYLLNRRQSFELYPNTTGNVVFLGDSQIENFELSELLRVPGVLNRGISGDTTKGVLNRLDEVIKRKPAKVFIEIGINDIRNHNSTAQHIADNEILIIERLKRGCPGAGIYWQSILPVGNVLEADRERLIAEVNGILKDYCQDNGVTYIDLYHPFAKANALNAKYDSGDHIHLSGHGYLLWRDILKSCL